MYPLSSHLRFTIVAYLYVILKQMFKYLSTHQDTKIIKSDNVEYEPRKANIPGYI
jgi:hypothetical protein